MKKQIFILVMILLLWGCHKEENNSGWYSQTSGTTSEITSVFFTDSITGFAACGDGILTTIDGGKIWTTHNFGGYGSFFFTDSNTGYLFGVDASIRTTDGGKNWKQIYIATNQFHQSPIFISLYFISNVGYLVGMNGIIAKSVDSGIIWSAQNSGTLNRLNSVFLTDTTTGYVVGDSGIILKTTNGGNTWNKQNSKTNNLLKCIRFTDANTGYTVGVNGTILKTTDAGQTWTAQTSGTTSCLYSIYFVNSSTGYIVGGSLDQIILKTNNGGASWNRQSGRSKYLLESVFFTDANTGYAVGYNGTILKTTSGGTQK